LSAVPSSCSKVILIVEDEEDTRELLKEILQERGFPVATAGDGVAALEFLAASQAVCLVLLDLVMPRLDGFGVIEALGGDPKLARIPVCITTSSPEAAPKGFPLLPKPVDLLRLFAVIETYCGPGAPS
jgi:CheY-like chemotaxis protein